MNNIKVLHTGDIHLGYEFGGSDDFKKERARELRETFSRIIDMCHDDKVDVLLIAGDLFDNDNPSEKLVNFVIEEFRRINEVIIMISPGNHDYYLVNTYYDKINTLCENVFIFDGEMDFYEFHIGISLVRIYGAGFRNKVCYETLMKQRKMPRDMGINIGVFHGTINGSETMNSYNPISLKQIEENGFDYLALGHIHKQTEVLHSGMTNYAYCGCPEGLNFGTQGIKGVYVGIVGNGYADMQYIPVCRRIYMELSVNVENAKSNRECAAIIERALIEAYGESFYENIYRIILSGEVENKVNSKEIIRELYELYYIEIIDKTIRNIVENRVIKNSRDNVDRKGRFVIKSIHIGNFGGLKDFSMEFNNKFNLIYGKNEFGKTTIMAFIKMMMYGCGSKSKDISLNLRKKYQPFDKSLMCGNIRFEINGKEYLVEKEFGKSKAYDIAHIYEMDTNREITFSKEYEVGDYFLKIGEEEFDKIIFDNNNCNYENGNIKESLLSRMVNLSAGLKEDDNSACELDKINKEIEKMKSKRGTSGEIPELTKQLDEYNDELQRLEEEKRNLASQRKVDFSMEIREKKIIENIIDDMEYVKNCHDGNEEKYIRGKRGYKKGVLFLVLWCIIGIIGFAILDKSLLGKAALGSCMVMGIASVISALFNYFKMKRNAPNRTNIQKRIDVLKEELGYRDYSVRDFQRRIREIDTHLDNSDIIEKISKQIDRCVLRIDELRRKKSELGEKYQEMLLKREELEEKSSRLKGTIAAPLNSRAVQLLEEMSGTNYDGLLLGENYSINFKKNGQESYKEWKYLSTATAMQAYLSLRISLCELLSENEMAFPLLLDDILNVCDDDRRERTIEVLRNLNTQVILFTCHK